MSSPFPGMDPYIEESRIYHDFHNNLASAIQAQLNARIQPNYYASIEESVSYEVIAIEKRNQRIRPDLSVWQKSLREAPVAYPVIAPAPVQSEIEMELPLELWRVEITSVALGSVVTVIEILSPVNKQIGHDAHEEYLRKRRELLRSPVHLMELDLLRGGKRLPLQKPVPDASYYILLSRANTRPQIEVWPLQLADKLPVLPVPLFEPDPDAPLDLGAAVTDVYERGAYRVRIDYREPVPPPRLSSQHQIWVDELLKTKRQEVTA